MVLLVEIARIQMDQVKAIGSLSNGTRNSNVSTTLLLCFSRDYLVHQVFCLTVSIFI